jgi:hypothetical protein
LLCVNTHELDGASTMTHVLAEDMPRGSGNCVGAFAISSVSVPWTSRECTASESLPGRPAVTASKISALRRETAGADGLIVDEKLGV